MLDQSKYMPMSAKLAYMKKIGLPVARENLIASLAIQCDGNACFPGKARNAVACIYREASDRLVVNIDKIIKFFEEGSRVGRYIMGHSTDVRYNLVHVFTLVGLIARKCRSECVQWVVLLALQGVNEQGD